MSVPEEGYSSKASCALNCDIYVFSAIKDLNLLFFHIILLLIHIFTEYPI